MTIPTRYRQSAPLTAPETEALHDYLQAATSDNTRKAYRSAIRQFEKWGGQLPTDKDTVIRYLLERSAHTNIRTLSLHITAIRQWHHYQGMHDPTREPLVLKAIEGIRRRHGQPSQKAKPLRLEHMINIIQHINNQPDSSVRRRDKALILTGFFGAFRRSELVGIQARDLEWQPEGVLIQLPRSKTDQHGQGMVRALPISHSPLCPASAIRAWLDAANISNGPIFRPISRWGDIKPTSLGAGSVNTIIKSLAHDCGLETPSGFSSHSFRRGLSTSAAREGVDFDLIRKQGGWKNDATVRGYIEEGQALERNAAAELLRKAEYLMAKNT